ncbi:type II toxin-antitoxin system HicB family antitoxin [bacterium]|nr:type II toxin-antitoxin system HicB family antitoxin [bacterium]
MNLRIVFEPLADGGFMVSCPDLPGCSAHGKTFNDALIKIKEVIQQYLQYKVQNKSILLN